MRSSKKSDENEDGFSPLNCECTGRKINQSKHIIDGSVVATFCLIVFYSMNNSAH